MTAAASQPSSDVARLTNVLRDLADPICASCSGQLIGVDRPRVVDAVAEVVQTLTLEQNVAVCGSVAIGSGR